MKRSLNHQVLRVQLLIAAILMFNLSPAVSWAASLNLATEPIAKASTAEVKPNLMFILDNSGSMSWDYMPNWVVEGNYCKSNSVGTANRCCRNPNGNNLETLDERSSCLPSLDYANLRGMPPFSAAPFNRSYYNPAITYSVPVEYNGSKKTVSYGTDYGAVPLDGYGKQTAATLNLKTGYPDVEWCTSAAYTDCLRNNNYLLPGQVNGKSYSVMHAVTTGSGTTNFATGTVAAPKVTAGSLGPYYYVMIPEEFCKAADLKECVTQVAPDASYTFPAPVRWCNSAALSNCKAVQDAKSKYKYNYPRYPTVILSLGTQAKKATGVLRVTSMLCDPSGSSEKTTVSSIKLGGTEMLTSMFTYCSNNIIEFTRNSGLAQQIASRIGNGFSATRSGENITVVTPAGLTYNGAGLSVTITKGTVEISTAFAGGSSSGVVAVPGSFKRVDILSSGTYGNITNDAGTYTVIDRSKRKDCAKAPTCTGAEELANFANWFAWYRTRMQMMKTSVSNAFEPTGNRYRIGFHTINDHTVANNNLAVSTFDETQKKSWYTKLFNVVPNGATPLREALSRVGRIYAGQLKVNLTDPDPVQYSCQQNFALLTTDGYWNGNQGLDLRTKGGGSSRNIGNLDGEKTTARPMSEGPIASAGSLADVAKYYYDTDLRNPALAGYVSTNDNCTANSRNVCTDNVFLTSRDNNPKQHMTTFALGLGVDGTLQYQSDYDVASSGDFHNIKNGVGTPHDWPEPVSADSTAVDDLWHAAVNGHGKYFSSKDSASLAEDLSSALSAINSRVGAGAAAGTSTLNPVPGDNFAYVASYTTVKWQGNLERRSINTETGVVSENASWCVEDVVAGECFSPSTMVAETVGGRIIYYCVTPQATKANCSSPGVLSGSNCKVEMPTTCTGKMAAQVAADNRTIYTASGAGLRTKFDSAFATANPTYFDSTKLSGLSQWSTFSQKQQAAASSNLVGFLRGNTAYENRTSNDDSNRLYRYREATLGDLLESEPAYLGKPTFSYFDPGYLTFRTNKALRPGTVYVGANDGMLHAFNAADGSERWAYIPRMVLPDLWKLADYNYGTKHANYVNGSPVLSDICTANCQDDASAVWKTILVGGLNGGGRGYYALDITDPDDPLLLWEFGTTGTHSDTDLGYSFGNPIVTKKTDGTWVVLFTSGYNNTSPGSGKGFLYVVNAKDGLLIDKIDTGVGTTTTPSGLAKISAWMDSAEKNNTAGYVYGGDLLGNVWRFNINRAEPPLQFAILKDANGVVQPITTNPELGKINSQRIVFVGTGKYLEKDDVTNKEAPADNSKFTQRQSLYAMRDSAANETLDNPRLSTSMVQQSLTLVSGTSTRTSSSNAVDWTAKSGWYIDFDAADTAAGSGAERVNVNMQLVAGTLLIPTTVPSNSDCSPGGFGLLNYLNYKTGTAINKSTNLVSDRTNATIVGVNVYWINGKPVIGVGGSDKPTPQLPPPRDRFADSKGSGFAGKRVVWRELIQ